MAAPVFYSICPFGTASIETGAGNISITNGVASLTVAQTGNIGAGVCIEYNSLNAYIAPNRIGFDSGGIVELGVGTKITDATSGATGVVRAMELISGTWAGGDAAGWIYFEKTTGTFGNNNQINRTKPTVSNNIATVNGTIEGNIGNGNTEFVVKTAGGGTPANQGATAVTSVHHEYASLSAFEAGFTDSNHINNTSLVAADVIAHACCYYDHHDQTADTTPAAISFGTTGADNYLQIFTPIGEAESINNQRHDGTSGIGYKLASTAYNSLNIFDEYVRIEGIEIDRASGTNDPIVINHNSIGGDVWISYCLINRGTGNRGINIDASNSHSANIYIFNNIIKGNGTASGAGIYNGRYGSIANHYIYNNTIEGFPIGIDRNYGTFIAKNNIITGCTAAAEGTFAAGTDYNATNNSSMGYTVTGGGNTHDRVSQTFTFIDENGDDFHLASNDAGAKDYGDDLSSDSDLPIWRDIDGNERGASWDIGADEYVAAGSAYTLTAESGSFTLNGQDMDLLLNRLLEADAGSFILTGQDVALLVNRILNAESGAFTLAGQDADLLLGRILNAESGSFTLSGQDANLLLGYLLNAESGAFTLTGQDATLLVNRILNAESGSFILTGQDVALCLGRVLGAEAGLFTLTGSDATLTYSGAASTYTLIAESGSFVLAGTDASLLANRILTVDSALFSLHGQDVNLLLNRLLNAGSGSFTLTGQEVTLLANRILNAESGAFTLAGQDAALLLGRVLSAEAGVFTLVGQDINLLADRKLNVETGVFNLVGQEVTLTWSGEILAVGKVTISFTSRKPGHIFTSRKPGHVFT